MLSRIVLSKSLCSRSLSITPRYLSAPAKVTTKEGVTTAQQQVDGWIHANKTKGRPMSPHLTVYAWTIPMAMSALNRIMAFLLTFAFISLPFIELYTGSAHDAIMSSSEWLRSSMLGTGFLYLAKAALFLSFFFHTFQGFRHWSWDAFALGIRNMDVFYKTGYIAIAASLICTALVTFSRSSSE